MELTLTPSYAKSVKQDIEKLIRKLVISGSGGDSEITIPGKERMSLKRISKMKNPEHFEQILKDNDFDFLADIYNTMRTK
jgi:hypothetical protein